MAPAHAFTAYQQWKSRIETVYYSIDEIMCRFLLDSYLQTFRNTKCKDHLMLIYSRKMQNNY